MKIKSLLLVFGLSALLMSGLTGCVASVRPDYGYYPRAPRVYYPVRPVIVTPAPYYRQGYRPHYDGYRGYGGGGYTRGRRH